MAQIKKINFTLDSEYNGKIIRDMSVAEKAEIVSKYFDRGTECIIEGYNDNSESEVSKFMDRIAPEVEKLNTGDTSAFLALSSDEEDIMCCLNGQAKAVVSMIAAHMLSNETVESLILAAVTLYAKYKENKS